MRAEKKCVVAGWPGDLPGWVADGTTPVRRVLLKLKNGQTVQTNDIQTARILRSIDHILVRKNPSYHCKMRLVDVMELQELEKFHKTSRVVAPVVSPPSTHTRRAGLDSSRRESRLERGLQAFEEIARLSLQHIGPVSSAMYHIAF